MAAICMHCHKGRSYGHAVSHAKNRVNRLFKANLQLLKVMEMGQVRRVKLCTSCIQRLKKDQRLGTYRLKIRTTEPSAAKPSPKSIKQAQSEIEKYMKESGIQQAAEEIKKEKAGKAKEAFDIEAIVGKKK